MSLADHSSSFHPIILQQFQLKQSAGAGAEEMDQAPLIPEIWLLVAEVPMRKSRHSQRHQELPSHFRRGLLVSVVLQMVQHLTPAPVLRRHYLAALV